MFKFTFFEVSTILLFPVDNTCKDKRKKTTNQFIATMFIHRNMVFYYEQVKKKNTPKIYIELSIEIILF